MLFYKVCGGGENAVAVRPFSACDAPELVSVSACGGIRGLEPAAAAALCSLQVTLLSSGESELTAFERAGRADQSGPSASLPDQHRFHSVPSSLALLQQGLFLQSIIQKRGIL